MKIELKDLGKRYRNEWILRGVNLCFDPGIKYAVTGPNGAGKSTLLKMLAAHLSPSKGELHYSMDGQTLEKSRVYEQLSYAAPYIDLIEELTLLEAIQFHFHFKKAKADLSENDLLELLPFKKAKNKPVKAFSSGMKQRLKLLLAICSETSLLLLDEPGTNLDQEGLAWYHQLMAQYGDGRLVIVASNVAADFDFCQEHVNVLAYKKNG
ncbi:MAG TPA: ABC transporter ATP-binding protein [Saprospiraceae bacterium]|nr:ABC transporter ATP-binding protein [Saprospiraceae bacterium]HMQ85488.1 ABC transporter ATP-binding protein [Saprospiraceae bacterium]